MTAGAEQILQGYTGCDKDGEPVAGTAQSWITEKVTGKISFTSNSTETNPFTIHYEKKPKALFLFIANSSSFAAAGNVGAPMAWSYNTYYGGRMIWIDGFLQTASEDRDFPCTITSVGDTAVSGNMNAYNMRNYTFYVYYELYY